jgi:hypothetical protein
MASATIAGAVTEQQHARAGRDRDFIINAIQEWVATYGEPPRAADWNPSSAKWSRQLWRVERYRAGRADGTPWPALNTAKRPFGGSLTAAIRAAGFEPAKPGPKRRSEVDPEQTRPGMSPEGRAMVAAALERARAAERNVERLEGKLARATRDRDAAVRRPPRVKVVRERVVDDAAVAAARMDAAEARIAAERMAAKLERAEATVATLRAERREPVVVEPADRTAERRLAIAKRERDAAAEAADRRVARVEREREAAERRALEAERELRATVAAVKGEARRLTARELAELRAAGPHGPAVMAAALKALAAARAESDRTALDRALSDVARAAVGWRERI